MSRAALRRALLLLVPLALVAVAAPAPAAQPDVPPAAPGTMMSLSPNAAFTGGQAPVVATTRTALEGAVVQLVITPTGLPDDPAQPMGETLLDEQYGTPLTAQGTTGTSWAGLLDLRGPTTRTPAAPGLYDAAVVVDGRLAEHCTGCYTILTLAPPAVLGPASLSPRVIKRNETLTVYLRGTDFADGTVAEMRLGGRLDPLMTVTGANPLPQGFDTATTLTRHVHADAAAALGHRDVSLLNTDGRSSTCIKCFTVTAPADKVEPTGSTNDLRRLVRVSVPERVPSNARIRLTWVGAGAPNPALDLTAGGSAVSSLGAGSLLEGTVDFAGATPGLDAYHAGYVLPDGSVHGCEGLCRFSVRQPAPPLITSLRGLSKVTTPVRTLTLTGTGFTRGSTITSSDSFVVVQKTTWKSTTSMVVVVAVDPEASGEPVEFTVANPDGQSSSFTSDPLEPGPPPPIVPVVVPEEGDPDPSRAPAEPTLSIPTASILTQKSLVLSGTADAGTALDLFALTRPGTTPQLVKTITAVGDSGEYTFVHAPSRNTRYHVVSRNTFGRTKSTSSGLQVRSAVALDVPTRDAARALVLKGQVLPRRANQTVRVLDVTSRPERLVAQGRTGKDGSYTLKTTRPLARLGRVRLQAVTVGDVVNAAGRSGVQVLSSGP